LQGSLSKVGKGKRSKNLTITQPKIFVSSTILDLPNERKAAYNAIIKAGALPVMSEKTIEAQNTDSLTTCLNKVKESDVYILILGGKYGWQPDGPDGKKESITELEFQTAQTSNIPVYVFNTTYPKDDLQKKFEERVENIRFRKTVSDADELENEIVKILKEEIEKKQADFFNNNEPVYSSLVKIKFPQNLYMAEFIIDDYEVDIFDKKRKKIFKRGPSFHDKIISTLRMKNISFPHDWTLHRKNILTFHDLHDQLLPISRIIDKGTIEEISCEEYYSISDEEMNNFKHLLRKCFATKLYKKSIVWIKEEGLYAFIPTEKDNAGQWVSRQVQWTKTKTAKRTVVDAKKDFRNETKVFNLKCLAFKSKFEFFDDEWFLSIKPDWIFLRSDFRVCPFAYKKIQWLKRKERNMHVFNHFNFILKYLQPTGPSLFSEHDDYRFLTIGDIEKFDFAPIVPDKIWANMESQESLQKLNDDNGDIGLFGL
jgi:hypothetical protein